MTTNKYFNNGQGVGTTSEQDLVESLIQEMIQMSGHDFYYIPRSLFVEDKLFQEVPTEKYENYYEIEMYVENVTDFGGQGELFSKFGLEIDDTVNLVCSRKRFGNQTGLDHPDTGDLIYFPLTKHLFEIKHIEDEPGSISGINQFYSLGKLYTYMFKCTLYRYSYDDFTTGIDEIDQQFDPDAYTIPGIETGPVVEAEGAEALDWSESNPFGETTN